MTPPSARVQLDIPYHNTATRTLKLDVYQPTAPPVIGDTYPIVIAIHGGGWRNGDKGDYFARHHRLLTGQGCVVFDIQYRFSDEAQWPAQLDDLRAAIRWVKAHAGDYKSDPNRIVLLGRSAGGHMALHAAYRASGDHADTAVQGVVALYAPTDMRLTKASHDERVVALLGTTSDVDPERYDEASPLDWVHENAPPTLLVHGQMDALVGPVHAERLRNRLRYHHVPVVLLRLPWSRHGFDAPLNGIGARLTQYYLDRFLAWRFYQ